MEQAFSFPRNEALSFSTITKACPKVLSSKWSSLKSFCFKAFSFILPFNFHRQVRCSESRPAIQTAPAHTLWTALPCLPMEKTLWTSCSSEPTNPAPGGGRSVAALGGTTRPLTPGRRPRRRSWSRPEANIDLVSPWSFLLAVFFHFYVCCYLDLSHLVDVTSWTQLQAALKINIVTSLFFIQKLRPGISFSLNKVQALSQAATTESSDLGGLK